MNGLKNKLLTNWHLMRILRAGIGVMLLVTGVQSKDWAMGLFSIFFLYQAIADVGCCGASGCAPRSGAKKTGAAKYSDGAIQYEEIK
jgi:hypothetical protein